MESVNKKTEYPCSGCGACAAVCPKRAIKLEPDELGLLTARVEAALCVDCGLCVRVCSRFSEAVDGTDLRETKLYAVQSANAETVKNCSSGGLAHELAMMAIREGGKAVGAVYDTETDRVFHEMVSEESGVQKLDGSKYLQSDPQEAFTQAIEEARKDEGARFTVFGTPCQITGLAKVCELLGVRERFLLVEIFCHGVPPYGLWEHQLKRMRRKLGSARFESVRFRYKKDDWHSYCIKAEANGKTYYGSREREPFWHVYFENVLLGDACMTCRLRKERSLADLRIGDYWGKRYQSRSDGVSAAFACTEKGRAAMDELISSGKLVTLEPGTPEEMLRAQNMQGYSELGAHEQAIEKLKADGIESAVRSYRSKETSKLKLKRALLLASGFLPAGIKVKLKKLI
jgi:coenzyme F420-reducing hydrogenase beta subunit